MSGEVHTVCNICNEVCSHFSQRPAASFSLPRIKLPNWELESHADFWVTAQLLARLLL